MIYTQQDFINHLLCAPTDLEQAHEDDLLRKTEILKESFSPEIPSHEHLTRFQLARVLASHSIKRDEQARAQWDSAQRLLQRWVDEDVPVGKNEILLLNHTLSGSGLRDCPVYTGGFEHPLVSEVPDLLDYFFDEIWAQQKTMQPLRLGHLTKMWLVSIHPFLNGNGRTAQLCADYVLLKNGYIPHSFRNRTMAMVACLPNKLSTSPHRVFLKFLDSVQWSYQILSPI